MEGDAVSRRARKYAAKPVYLNAVQIAISRARPLAQADLAGQRLMMQTALRDFSQGINCDRHWCSLADTANMAETLAGMGLGAGADADRFIAEAQQALHAVHSRHTTRGTWTLYPAELQALDWLVWLHGTVQLPACSYGELGDALESARNRLQQALAGNAPRGALVVDGGMGSTSPN
jgi:hypothetical protein